MKATLCTAARLEMYAAMEKAEKNAELSEKKRIGGLKGIKSRNKNLKNRYFQVINKYSGKVYAEYKYLAWAKKEMELLNEEKKSYAIAEVKRTTIIK